MKEFIDRVLYLYHHDGLGINAIAQKLCANPEDVKDIVKGDYVPRDHEDEGYYGYEF